ncbi:hypothetical protein HDU99_010031, partial [Rhizoclosmatium hyalinum]
YYAQFVHQQNMLQDSIRTLMYQNAILSNSERLFKHKLVIDVGAGSGALLKLPTTSPESKSTELS